MPSLPFAFYDWVVDKTESLLWEGRGVCKPGLMNALSQEFLLRKVCAAARANVPYVRVHEDELLGLLVADDYCQEENAHFLTQLLVYHHSLDLVNLLYAATVRRERRTPQDAQGKMGAELRTYSSVLLVRPLDDYKFSVLQSEGMNITRSDVTTRFGKVYRRFFVSYLLTYHVCQRVFDLQSDAYKLYYHIDPEDQFPMLQRLNRYSVVLGKNAVVKNQGQVIFARVGIDSTTHKKFVGYLPCPANSAASGLLDEQDLESLDTMLLWARRSSDVDAFHNCSCNDLPSILLPPVGRS